MSAASEIKATARRAVHTVHAAPCICTTPDGSFPTAQQVADGLTLGVRVSGKLRTISSEPEHEGVSILENIERLTFSADELAALGLTLDHGTEVSIPAYGLIYVLDQHMDPDGPVNEYWTVTRQWA